jgi:hypothetical protein
MIQSFFDIIGVFIIILVLLSKKVAEMSHSVQYQWSSDGNVVTERIMKHEIHLKSG